MNYFINHSEAIGSFKLKSCHSLDSKFKIIKIARNIPRGFCFFNLNDLNPRDSHTFALHEARIPRWCIPIQSDRSRIPFTSVAAQSHLPRFDARHCPIRNSGHYLVGYCRNFTVSSSNFRRARPVFTSVTNSRKNSTELCQCFLRRLRECRLSCSTIASGSFSDCPSSVCSVWSMPCHLRATTCERTEIIKESK